jgi:hypothetical protein
MNFDRAVVALLAAVVGGVACAGFDRGGSLVAADAAANVPADAAAPGLDLAIATDGTGPAALSFARDVNPLLVDLCGRCHSPSGQASRTTLVLVDDAASNLAQVQKLVNSEAPAASRLLGKAGGTGHEGGAIVRVGTPDYQTILSWITQGGLP